MARWAELGQGTHTANLLTLSKYAGEKNAAGEVTLDTRRKTKCHLTWGIAVIGFFIDTVGLVNMSIPDNSGMTYSV